MTRQMVAGVAGTGFIGPVHVEALRRAGVEVRGIVGSSAAESVRAAEELHVPVGYATFDEMIADPAIDCVHIATPNHLHAPQALAALRAGKHVVCEKPLAMNAAEGAALLAEATSRGRVHCVNFNLRFYAQVHQARAMAQGGDLGDLYLIHGNYLQDWLLKPTDWNWRLDPALGGDMRAVADIGSHWLDMAGFVTGRRVEAVMADFATLLPVRKRPLKPLATFAGKELDPADYEERAIHTEDYATVMLRFEGGARGVLTVSQVSAGRKNHLQLEVDGAQSSVVWNSERPEDLWIGHRDRPSEILMRDPGLLAPEARAVTSYPGGHAEGYPDTFKQLYRKVYAAVAAGAPPATPDFPTFADGLRALQLGEAILQSARESRWVTVPAV
jgi:predicted dehydrogenase